MIEIPVPSSHPPDSSTASKTTALSSLSLTTIVLVFWFTFGLGTIVNHIALWFINSEAEGQARWAFPISLKDSIWLVVTIWASAYIISMVAGLLGSSRKTSSLVASAVIGYELAVFLMLIFLKVLPSGQRDGFRDIWGILTLEGVPGYLSFLFLTVGFGVIFVGLAVFTGQVLAKDTDFGFDEFDLDDSLDARIVISAVIFPLALLISSWGGLILVDSSARHSLTQNLFTNFHLPYFGTFMNPFVHMVIVALCGGLIALSPHIKSVKSILVSVAVGLMLYVQLFFISKDMLMLFAPDGYVEKLDLHAPALFPFSLFWLGLVLAGLSATLLVFFVVHGALLNSSLSKTGSAPETN